MRLSCWNGRKSVKILLYIVLASFIMLSLCGAKYDNSKAKLRDDGTEITFRGYIIDKLDDKRILIWITYD